jgi:hypothetical protein
VDESGGIHYGDTPPHESDVELVTIPEGPSQEVVDAARTQMQKTIDRYEKFSEEASPAEPLDEATRKVESHTKIPDDVECFSPFSDLIEGPSGETFTPTTATSLTKEQQKALANLFSKLDAYWQGTISDLICSGSVLKPDKKVTSIEAKMTAIWDVRQSRLTIKTETIDKERHTTGQLIYRLEIGNALYFNDNKLADVVALEGNKVELLNLEKNNASFLIKRRVQTWAGALVPRGEVRYFTTNDRTFKLIEHFYNSGVLTGSKTWVLSK